MANQEKIQNFSEIEKLLQQNVEKEILVKLKNKITIKGKLRIFDQHLNLTLQKGTVIFGEKNEFYQDLLVRGSDIILISLLDSSHSK